eukprot:g443.t1
MKVLKSVAEAIGNTPLVRLDRLTKRYGAKGTILAKLEYLNPGFSKKDRAAMGIIEEAEQLGLLSAGQTVVELTSGNMGTGLAIVCRLKGYPFVAVMSKGNSRERAKMMQSLGAEVILVDQMPDSIPGQVSGEDLDLVDEEAKKVTKELNAFRADQFYRDGNWKAHYKAGVEILDATSGKVDAFADFLGSAGTYKGISKAFKERNSNIQCFVVEPEGAAVLAGKPVTNSNHPIQGGGYIIPDLKFLDREVQVDGFLEVSPDEVKRITKQLAKYEGIFSGYSAGANVAAALQLLKRGDMAGKTIAVVICDSGLKYLSTTLFD